MIDLRHYLLAGHTGRRVVGVIGIVLFSMRLSGLLLWLLRRPSLKALFTVTTTGPKRRFHFELHRATAYGSTQV